MLYYTKWREEMDKKVNVWEDIAQNLNKKLKKKEIIIKELKEELRFLSREYTKTWFIKERLIKELSKE